MTHNTQTLIYEYYKAETLKQGLFVLLDIESFQSLLNRTHVYVESSNNKIKGLLIISCHDEKYFVTLHYGDDISKHKLLLKHIKDHPDHDLWIHFFNPDCLFWYPKTNIIHPCMQGVIEHSNEDRFYRRFGFQINSIQETYYRSLVDFQVPDDILGLKDAHKINDIVYVFYDASKHHGLIEFTDRLDAPHWKHMILQNETSHDSKPLLIALKKNQIVGFAGPLGIDTFQRGTFSGIGVLFQERGQKIGKLLFFELCQRLKSLGASYMTLFTGTSNPARHIYLAAGFVVIARCATLKYVKQNSDL
jgi:ribosomal protein S18 acetylase RimI-like enzyme